MECLENVAVAYRNFNVCPHCKSLGQQPLLGRLCEGLPMISRSDGNSFHLLLADRPLPYPNDLSSAPTDKISVCFWYSHISNALATQTTIVTLVAPRTSRAGVFRAIEAVADMLAEVLARRGHLREFYDFTGEVLFELSA